MPKTVTATQLQRKYSEVKKKVKEAKGPVVVLSSNEPEMVLIDYDFFSKKQATPPTSEHEFDQLCGSVNHAEILELEESLKDFEQIDWDAWK